jgi:hypothetical protein
MAGKRLCRMARRACDKEHDIPIYGDHEQSSHDPTRYPAD